MKEAVYEVPNVDPFIESGIYVPTAVSAQLSLPLIYSWVIKYNIIILTGWEIYIMLG